MKTTEEWVSWFKTHPVTADSIALIQKEAVENYKSSHLNPKNIARAEKIRGALRGMTNELG